MKKITSLLLALCIVVAAMAQPPKGPAKKGMNFGAKTSVDGAIAANELTTVLADKTTADVSYEAKLFPNPAPDGWTQVQLHLPSSGTLKVDLYDLQGRLLKSAYNNQLQAGNYLLPVSLSEFPQGFYLVKTSFNNSHQVLRLVNIKQ